MANCSETKEPIYFIVNTWGGIGAIIFIPVTIWSMHKYRKDYALQRKNKTATPKCLYCTQMTFYVTCLLYLLLFFIAHVSLCLPLSIWWTLANFSILSYVVHWALVIAIYLARLYYVFKDTAYELTKRHVWYYIGFTIFLIIFIILIQAIRMVDHHYIFNIFSWVVTLLLIAMLNIVLSGMFVVRLKRVNSNLDNTANAAKTLAAMRKYAVVTICSSCTTLLFIIYLGISTSLPRTLTVQNTADMLNSLDVYMDIVCITLPFAFAKSYYYQICACCDRGLARLCGHASDDEAKLKSMADTELQVSSDKGASRSDATGATSLESPSPSIANEAGSSTTQTDVQ